ncbi:MAG: glycoside hydrolase family 3 protein [Rickettsiales bacterium]|nr:glycoside hydrolase family 3 protein [Rickettsiales bacterium]
MFLKHKAIIFGIPNQTISLEEKKFFSSIKPLGFILFSRNISNKKQVISLINDLRNAVNNKYAPIFIDQEGGRVCRLKKPIWYTPPPAAIFGKIANTNLAEAKKALQLNTTLIALDLIELGISADAVPVIDILNTYTHTVIGDRAYSSDKLIVTELGKIVCDTLTELNIAPIIKHIPGHGRAKADSHLELPVVDTTYKELLNTDFYPFIKLNNTKLAMTAHVLYKSIDAKHPATLSKKVVSEIRNTINFKNILLTDCICMKALSGSMLERTEKALNAGCDIILHSRGTIEEMKTINRSIPFITENQNQILKELFVIKSKNFNFKRKQIESELNELLQKHKIDISSNFSSIDPTQQNF